MRRSAAPSSRHGQLGRPGAGVADTNMFAKTSLPGFGRSSSAAALPPPALRSQLSVPVSSDGTPAVRSTASVLSLLGQLKKPSREVSPPVEASVIQCSKLVERKDLKSTQSAPTSSSLPPDPGSTKSMHFRIYRVVWGKPTTKKHKTWEGDGTLEVGEKTATLKDEEGKILGRATQVKTAELEEGTRLKVGSKEVELIDLLSGPAPNAVGDVNVGASSSKRPASEPPEDLPQVSWKKPKKKPSSGLVKFTTEGCEPFVLPTPSHDHQWTFNTKQLAVNQVAVDNFLTRVLRPHQKEGVTFLYECVMGMKNSQCFGAILADEMGLGKTLQTITLLWTLLRQGPYGGNPVVRRALVVSPSSLVLNWQKEFDRWLGKHRLRTFAVDQKNKVIEFARLTHVPVMLISYEMLMRNFDDISNIKFDILVCDEGHRLKNNNIRTSVLLNQLDIKARILLTGTPIQNDLQEYFALVDFVNPGILGSAAEFRREFEEPIVASQEPNCAQIVRRLGEERAGELNSKTSCFILRRTQAVINQYLPTKTEVVVFIKPAFIQKLLCRAALDWWENRDSTPGSGEGVCHLGVMTALKKICNHPALIRCEDFFDEEAGMDSKTYQESLLQELSDLYNAHDGTIAVHHSAKLTVVRRLLEHIICLRERVVLISYFTQTLDLLSSLCDEMGLKCSRLDGSTPASQRTNIVDEFNSSYSKNVVFLLSARAGGVGLNLTGASRLVLFDSDWNPATDAQAMSRIWRDGQKQSVYIYRLLTCGTIEEKIFQRQLSKAGLSGAVVDPQKHSSIKLSKEELKDLFTFHGGDESLTHCSLGCNCDGKGTVPSPEDNPFSAEKENEFEDDERDCQLRLGLQYDTEKKDASDLRMNQLFEWQHHAPPFIESSIQVLGLAQASELLAFMFVSPPATASQQ
ncbi:hypothetical protein ONE63_006338 [Megalurothrips usitatus]|uniref:DNA repair and recombination protein RAD54-like n=1 Tax=Megalurothrips usitatus TaxID=439358 RepID=A0AAV7XT20_9NEOP|nr:hypothetical protein ONE63_006338 [Megalurothrips usitatus]